MILPDDLPSALYNWSAPPARRLAIDVADSTLCDAPQSPSNLRLVGRWPHTLGALAEYCESAASLYGVVISTAHPVVGSDAFRTGTGAHATALVKALRAGNMSLADDVGSAVPASVVGAAHGIDVDPVSGLSNVRWWLSHRGYDAGDLVLMRELLLCVKQMQRVASDDELREMADSLLTARTARS